MRIWIVVLTIWGLAFAGSVQAKDEFKPTVPEGYRLTGVVENGVRIRSIRRTSVVDDHTILFFMTGGKVYANIMKFRCAGLAREERFGYTVRIGELTSFDVISVMDTLGVINNCGLGKFYEVEKLDQPKDENGSPS